VRDGPFRSALKGLVRFPFEVNLTIIRAWMKHRGQWPWELGGSCQGCAQCCEAPGIQVGRFIWFFPSARRVFIWWQRVVNGFLLTGEDKASRLFVFNCTHFDRATRRCDSYETRPGICRDYPRVLLQQANPELMPGCGYRPVLRSANAMLKILDEQPMSDSQREKLKKELRLG
jgi:uncharacterized protein